MQNDIEILGAGIMGLTAAYKIADTHKITIYDPAGFPADNASLMAGGMLAPYSEIEHMDMHWVKAGLEGVDAWENAELDTGFSRNGSLLIAHPEDRYILERFKTHLPSDKQTYQNVQSLEEQITQSHQHGLFLEQEAHLDPVKTMNSLCDYLQNHKNVTLEKGPSPQSSSSTIVDCRGMAANDPDLRGVKGEILIVRNPEFSLSRPVRLMHPRYPLYIIPREDNIFMIGATVIESADNQNVSLRSSMELMSALYALSPSFAESEIITLKAGIRPSYADNLPRITINDNTISCNGLFRHGYLLAPVMADCVHDYLNGIQNKFMPLFNKGNNDENHDQRPTKRYAQRF